MALYKGYSRHYYVPTDQTVQEIHPLSVVSVLACLALGLGWAILSGFGVV